MQTTNNETKDERTKLIIKVNNIDFVKDNKR